MDDWASNNYNPVPGGKNNTTSIGNEGWNDNSFGIQKEKPFNIQTPSITLPKGGGAIKSIDEKFSVNAANGTSGFSIPFPFSPSRNSFMPSLSLGYNSGSGNGVFGLGWSGDAISITRKTEKELPKYDDENESDTFLSGVEDLVPALDKEQNWRRITKELPGIGNSFFYRPRIEGSFARIERIVQNDGEVFWRVTSKENITSIFGKSNKARIADPADASKVFKWLLEFSYDDKGNCFQFEYKTEDQVNVANVLHEKNRLKDLSPFTNTYLKRIKYCNETHFDKSKIDFTGRTDFPGSIKYLFELVLDYGEYDQKNPQPDKEGTWESRHDPFSDYRAGFEIRTYRLCKRLLMFHNFKELGGTPCLVRSMDFGYDKSETFSFLNSITQTGYIRKNGSFTSKSLPPFEFGYQPLGWNTEVKNVTQENIINAPIGIDDKNYQWIDLYGEGVSGILTEQSNALFYKSNLGDAEFTIANLVSPKPSLSGLSTGTVQLQDIEANGKKFLVSHNMQGYFELSEEDEWQPFRNFEKFPSINWQDPNLKFIDLNGDGLADILISEDEVFTWYSAKGKKGYDEYQQVRRPLDEDKGPSIIFADGSQSVVLADMSGDGLTDIVRIKNGEVVYWPNLGYGRFGAKVTMSNGPVFDYADAFNPKFIKLADIDGSGTTDIVYLGKNSFKIYFNQSGNSWSEENIIKGVNPLPFPKVDELTNVSVIDLLGKGTSCIVWSSPLPVNAPSPLLFIDLMGGKKPHLMTSYKNNLGKEIFLQYVPSTQFYLQDKKDGKKWITKLPFPVQCVSHVEVKDRISKTRYANEYSYHHGFYDYTEREFRGFGRVEQTDTDSFNNENLDQHPVLTKTWFHTGAFLNKEKILNQFRDEYFYNNPEIKKHFNDPGIAISEKELTEPPVNDDLTAEEWREALRACKSLPLRVEIFANDDSDKTQYPYSSAQHTCLIKLVQPKLENKHAVFVVHESEALTYHYERNPADPRIAHSLNTVVDEFGNVQESASIVYGRKNIDPGLTAGEQKEQSKLSIVYTLNNFTNDINDEHPDDYRLRVLYETKTYELIRKNAGDNSFFKLEDLKKEFSNATEIKYEEDAGAGQKRLIEHVRNLFLKNDLSVALPLGTFDSLALPFESYKLAFTKSLVDKRFSSVSNKVDDALLTLGKYLKLPEVAGAPVNPDKYWIHSGTQNYDANNFYEVIKVHDPFGNPPTVIEYDKDYHFYIQKITDPIGNVSEIDVATFNGQSQNCFNFRTLSPYVMKDMNENRTGVRTDELGLVRSTFIMGKAGETLGDPINLESPEISVLDKPTTTLDYTIDSWFNQSKTFAAGFNLDAGDYKPKPNFVKLKVREQHESVTSSPVFQESYSYSDGSGHEIMKKIQAEPGDAPQRDINRDLGHDAAGNLILADTSPKLRWVGTGRTILNNKGKPVKQYEPFFSSIFDFEDEKEMVETGVTPIIHYDPLDRVIQTDFPDGTFSKVEFDSWQQKTFDQNDTIEQSKWFDERITHAVPAIATTQEIDAANKARLHNDTPTIAHLDSLGRTFLTIADNADKGNYKTRTELDIENNQRKVIDAVGNTVMEYEYDMLGNKIKQISMDGGDRFLLNDVYGKPFRSFDSRNHEFRYEYDFAHRPIETFVKSNGGAEKNFEKIIYGEGILNDKTLNLRGKPSMHFDTAGVVTNELYDFKGNLLQSSRQLLKNYKDEVDWQVLTDADLEQETFTSATEYDALNRPVKITSPDNSIIRPVYNEANLLNELKVSIKGTAERSYVKNIDYDAKGQRESILYGNDVLTTYEYDPKTFRLKQLTTKSRNDLLQDLHYTYDPVGNVTQIEDKAQQTIFFNNAKVAPVAFYEYDAIYRLTKANGREHIGQNQLPQDNWNDINFTNLPHKGDGNAMRNYTQNYFYDEVGNIIKLVHAANGGSYTRTYAYNNNDTDRNTLNVPAVNKKNNQLLATTVDSITFPYKHDVHGNMISMPHLSLMEWDFKDQLHSTQQTVDNSGTGERTYYVYDAAGQRVRKITEQQGTTNKKEERIYLGGFEIYRNYKTDGTTVELERETLHIMDDKRRVALIETKTEDNGSNDTTTLNVSLLRYQYDNHLGSAYLELDDKARIISYEEYHPYGTTAYQAIDKSINPVAKRYRYTGKERDEESGFNYHEARYYASWLGRWINPDRLGIKYGINLYEFVLGNPIISVDKNGEMPVQVTSEQKDKINKRLLDITDEQLNKKGFNPKNISPREKAYNLDVVEVLASAIEDNAMSNITESSHSANEARHIIGSILSANNSLFNNSLDRTNIPNFQGGGSIIKITGVVGFRKEFRDSDIITQFDKDHKELGNPNSQLAHFATAVSIGLYTGIIYREIFPGRHFVTDRLIRTIIGHEKIDLNNKIDNSDQYKLATDDDVKNFIAALDALGDGMNGEINLDSALKILSRIKIGNKDLGASMEDLAATLVGYKFGLLVAEDKFKNPHEAAQWLRRNVDQLRGGQPVNEVDQINKDRSKNIG